MTETWRPVIGWEGYYEVSDHGRVRSLDRIIERRSQGLYLQHGRILRPTNAGHQLNIGLHHKGIQKDYRVHRLVLEAFIGPCPQGQECCHNDGDYTNNGLANLRWDTPSNNKFDAVRHGTHIHARKTHCNNGHEFTPANTYISPRGYRRCRICLNGWYKTYYRRRKAA